MGLRRRIPFLLLIAFFAPNLGFFPPFLVPAPVLPLKTNFYSPSLCLIHPPSSMFSLPPISPLPPPGFKSSSQSIQLIFVSCQNIVFLHRFQSQHTLFPQMATIPRFLTEPPSTTPNFSFNRPENQFAEPLHLFSHLLDRRSSLHSPASVSPSP